MTTLLLHDYFRSSASYRVRIALNLKGLDYQRAEVSLIAGEQRSDAYLEQNAQGFVPMLVADGEPISIGQLAQDTVTKQPTLTRLLDRMEARGQVERLPGQRFQRIARS